MAEGNYVEGGFSIEAFTIINQHGETVVIDALTVGVTLYESIFSKFCSGQASILDGLDLLKNYRFTGQEYLRISIKQKEGFDEEAPKEFTIDKTFKIYKVENIQRPQESMQSYVLKFCDPRQFFVTKKRLSKTFRGSKGQMLQDALLDETHFYAEEFDLWEETTPANHQFICPNWTVNRFMDWCITTSQSEKSDGWRNSMFFYQTLNGGFRFGSVDGMFQREFPVVFSFKPTQSDLETADKDLNAPGGLNSKILSYFKPQQFDTLAAMIGGAYGSSMKVYDPVRKLEEDVVYDYKETMARGTHLSGFPLIVTDEDEVMLSAENQIDERESPNSIEVDVDLAMNKEFKTLVDYTYTSNHTFDNSESIAEDEVFQGTKHKDNGRLERRALLEILEQHKMIVTIPLRTDISAGTVIQLAIPGAETLDGNVSNNLNDDRYLITDLSVNFEPASASGIMHLECVKESYTMNVMDAPGLESSEKAAKEI